MGSNQRARRAGNRVGKVVRRSALSFSHRRRGNEVDTVGVGHGKANEVPVAIQKAVDDAKKNLFRVPSTARRSPPGRGRHGRRVLLKPPPRVPASSGGGFAPCSSSPESTTS